MSSLDVPAYFGSGFSGSQGSAPQGLYYYTTTFTLTGTPASFSGSWASDNQGVEAIVNGTFVLPAVTNNQFGSFTPLSIPASDFTAGVNTLTFVTWNENYQPTHGSPTGLDVQATITSVPEPSALVVVASGLPIIGLFWAARRRRRMAV